MKEITLKIKIPEEINEIAKISESEISLLVNRILKKKLLRIAKIERILSKSKLSEKRAEEIAREISISLSKEYEKIYEQRKKK